MMTAKASVCESPDWSITDATETYGVDRWGGGYFEISQLGKLQARLDKLNSGKSKHIDLADLVGQLDDRGIQSPLLLRFPQILESRIHRLNQGFNSAIEELKYQGNYRGVLPIKVNQQQQVAEEVAEFGQQFHYGFEVGSKAELICALAYLKDKEALLICNGYKDETFIELAFYGQMMGLNVVLVLEMQKELQTIEKVAARMDIQPTLGIHTKLSAEGVGQWAASAGAKSPFGLNLGQVLEIAEYLKSENKLSWLQMLHCHQGSQISDLTVVRRAVEEAVCIYCGLVSEGANMKFLNLGGGLAVDYDGSRSTRPDSSNYSVEEYCRTVVSEIKKAAEDHNLDHPTIVTESGRAIVAHYAMLVVEVIDVNPKDRIRQLDIDSDLPHPLKSLIKSIAKVSPENVLEMYGKFSRYQDEIHDLFLSGEIGLKEKAVAEQAFWSGMTKIAEACKELRYPPDELREISSLLADQYYANFSIFQSLPDSWAINLVFPVMPLQRLDERPDRQGVIHDVTCDCDGSIKRYTAHSEIFETLPLHHLKPEEPYYIGIFLVGAYQETLSDLHNLFGDSHAVSVEIDELGEVSLSREVEGDSVADVLSYVEHNPNNLTEQFRALAESAIRAEKITPTQRKIAMDAYRRGLSGYTYFQS